MPTGTPQYTKEFFDEMKLNALTKLDEIQLGITSKDYSEGWKVMKESTASTSLKGLHFGHMKASAQDPLLTTFESSIAHTTYTTGYSPNQWQESVIVMIKNKINLNNITALCSVVLTKADFNFNNKVLGRRTIQRAEMLKDLAPEQYGSRSNKSAIEQALHKTFTYDIIRQTRRPGAMCSNDAKSCYDSVIKSNTMKS